MLAFCAPPTWRDLLSPNRWPPRPPTWGGWLAVLLLVVFIELCLLPMRRPRFVAAPVPEGAVLITSEWGEKPILRQVPAPGKGDPTWEKGPCAKPYTEISGYCFAELSPEKFKPPCAGGLYEHAGRCFAPVVKANPNRSVTK